MYCPYCEEDAATNTSSLCYVAAIPSVPNWEEEGENVESCDTGRHRYVRLDQDTVCDLAMAVHFEIARAIG
jgi:hypothetical protein